MNASISVLCYKSKTLSNGEHPLMLRISKDGKKKYASIGVSISPQFWDFNKNQPKRSCPHRDAIIRLIAEKTKQYQEQLIEFKAENKDFTATALIQKVDKPTKRMTVGELFLKQIKRLYSTQRIGYALSYKRYYVRCNCMQWGRLSASIINLTKCLFGALRGYRFADTIR